MAAPKSGKTAKKPSDQLHGEQSKQNRLKERLQDSEFDHSDEPPPEPPEANPEWTPAVAGIWDSLLDSPLRIMFEKSDWNFYHYACNFLSETEKGGFQSGKMMTARQLLNDMTLTLASRQAANITIKRAAPVEDPRKSSSMAKAAARRDQRKAS